MNAVVLDLFILKLEFARLPAGQVWYLMLEIWNLL
jgi:hypothetical protein